MDQQKTQAHLFANQQLTPLMQQYWEIKSQFEDSMVFFQVGDFYELFFKDAEIASKELTITLTSRGTLGDQAIPLCGVPRHAADYYIIKLAKAGFKVVICDQLEDAQQGKLVRRGVSRVITPGTMTDSALLAEKKSSYLMVLTPKDNQCSVLVAELLTGLLWTTTVPLNSDLKFLQAELVRFTPDEIIVSEELGSNSLLNACKLAGYMATLVRKQFDNFEATDYQNWKNRFTGSDFVPALQTFYGYMCKYQPGTIEYFKELNFYKIEDYLYLDAVTQKTLEITEGLHGDRSSTLFNNLDETVTPMGARLLRQWLTHPLKDLKQIIARQEAVRYFYDNILICEKVRSLLKKLPDFERVVGRCLLLRGTYNDYQALHNGLLIVNELVAVLTNVPDYLVNISSLIGNFEPLIIFLRSAIADNSVGKGFDLELDSLRSEVDQATIKLLEFEQQEKSRTGITSLKVVYNQVHGYLIEITNTNLGSVPSHYEPYQKLSGRERFTVPELRALEQQIARAKRQVEALEKEVFARITQAVIEHARALRLLAQAYAQLDLCTALAHLASTRSYVCPKISAEKDLFVKDGRHPVIERLGGRFVPNDIKFDSNSRSLIITGPNMGGKSTYLRQSALIIVLAHIGSFVPASSAVIPLTDMICTRIGTGDNLKEGKSTFLIEMEETAAICTAATDRTLVLLDEVGRGTSTEDGVALAHAVVEYLHEKGCMLMFATHYQELTGLEAIMNGIKNLHVVVEQTGDKIIFLHSIAPGIAQSSFGIEVARLSGMPQKIVDRAYELLKK